MEIKEFKIFLENHLLKKKNIELKINGKKTNLIDKYKLKEGDNNITLIIKNKITNLSNMFYQCQQLKDIHELKYLNTKYCNDFNNMFNKCTLLTDIKPLENWNVSNGTNFSCMFKECSSLSDIKPLENWDVSNGTNFNDMLHKCPSLNNLTPLKKWYISNQKINEMELQKFEIKLCSLSDGPVGKTAICRRLCDNKFNENFGNTIGGAYFQKIIKMNSVWMKLLIWDTNGNCRFRNMNYLHYHDAQVSILVYDVKDEESFKGLSYWIDELKDKIEMDNMVLYLVGNKNDVDQSEKKVSTSKGKEFAEKNNMIFYEISAKNGSGVIELFNDIANRLFKKKLFYRNDDNKKNS